MKKAAIKKFAFYVFLSVTVIAYFLIRLPELKQSFLTGTTHPYDFPQDYIAGQLLFAGKSLYPPDFMHLYETTFLKKSLPPGDRVQFMNAHPPFTALLLSPLWLLSFHTAALVWAITTAGCMFVIILLLLGSEDESLLFFPLAVLFAFAWKPFQLNLSMGQTSILVTLFVIAGWYFLKRSRDGMAGIALAMATMLKFYPGLLIVYLLISKRYKALLYSFICIGAVGVVTFLTTRNDFVHFLSSVVPYDVHYWQAHLENYSLRGFAAKLFLSLRIVGTSGAFTASLNQFHLDVFLYSMDALLLLLIGWGVKRYDFTGDAGYSVFIIAALLLSPLCWDHYLTLLLLPLIVLIKELSRKNTLFEIVLFLAALFLVSIDTGSVYFQKAMEIAHAFISGNPLDRVYRLTFYSAQFYGMVLLLFLNFRMIKRCPPERDRVTMHKNTSPPCQGTTTAR